MDIFTAASRLSRPAVVGDEPMALGDHGLIGAAARIDLALRLRDEGAERQPRHAIDPFGPEPGAR